MTLDAYLKKTGISEETFASLIGVSQAAVNRYRHGLRTPNRETMQKIASATRNKVTANDFFAPRAAA